MVTGREDRVQKKKTIGFLLKVKPAKENGEN